MDGKVKIDESFQILVIGKLSSFFLDRCSDKSTLEEVVSLALPGANWVEGHDLFQRIRIKTLNVQKTLGRTILLRANHFKTLECQYLFEEVCAKTIYNHSGGPAPFDRDSSNWIVPNALRLGRHLEIDEDVILDIAN